MTGQLGVDRVQVLLLLVLLALSWALVYGIRRWAQWRRILDLPNQRSSHTRATPRGGGLAITGLTMVAVAAQLAFGRFEPVGLAYLGGALIIAAISWLDDLRSISNRARFACHVFGALVVLAVALAGSRVEAPLLGDHRFPWWAIGCLLFPWIVGLTNIYNFLDGIDGIAGGQAVVAAGWWLAIGLVRDLPLVTTLALAIAASSAGFLLHNWSPARIFMGDVGSTFLGYSFATMPLLGLHEGGPPELLIGGILLVWPFLFDGGLTIIRRALQGENIFQAHRSHLYQRLVIRGWSHRAVSRLYIGYALVSGACAFAIVEGQSPLLALLSVSLGLLLAWWVGQVDRRSATVTS